MSEALRTQHEHVTPSQEIKAERPKTVEYAERDRTEHIKHAQETVAIESAKSERVMTPDVSVTDDRPYLIDNAVKMLRMRQNLTEVQKRLKPAQKRLSNVIHQPAVRRVSESASKTISRPSGLLGGGVIAFAGSLVYLYLTSTLGFAYNYLFFLLFFIAGFVLGIAIEYALYGLRRLIARS